MSRVAYVCADPGVPVFGTKGSSVHVQEVVRGFRRHGKAVVLFATRWGGEAAEDLRGVGLRPLPPLPSGAAEARARAALAANSALTDELASAGPFDLLYERYSLWSRAGMQFARGAGIPGVLEVNAPLLEEQARHRGGLPLPDEAEAVARTAFRNADVLVAVSPGVAAWLDGFPEARGRVTVIANGVDPMRFPPRDISSGAGDAPVTLGFLGTLKPWHGLPLMVSAAALLRAHHGLDVRLLIVGDGPERDALVAELARHGMAGHAKLTGAVPPDAVPDLLAEMDIAIAPYPALENFYFSPLKIQEYMAAGLPVVATSVGHLAQVVRDGEDGLLCPPDDAGALAMAVARLAADPALRKRLGEAGRARVLRDHSWNSVVARILATVGMREVEAAPA